MAKTILQPLLHVATAMGNGHIYRRIGSWLRQYVETNTTILEIGCGSMHLRKYLPTGCFYNAVDLSFSEFQLRRSVTDPLVNLAMASALSLPVSDRCVDMVVATEVLEHIPQIDTAVEEIRRILTVDGRFLCSIPNNFGIRYKVHGENPDHVNKWSLDGFSQYMKGHGFIEEQRCRKGLWVPFPSRLLDMTVPIDPQIEFLTSTFMYSFRVR